MTGVERARPDAGLVLPEGTRLVHIGPPKTGTSAVQAAFHGRRHETLAQGVRYAGSSRHSGAAVLAVSGRPAFTRDAGPPPIAKWHTLVREVRAAREPRVLVSSEFFADAEPPAIHRAVEDLGRDLLHVVATLRPLHRIIPSQWQQYVQSNLRLGYDEWLEGILRNPPGPTPTFWRRHRVDALVERWAAEVGPDRMTVVVIDESDHDHILRVFEGLLGLRTGTLVAEDEIVNRSMTWAEIEAVRAFNVAFREAGLGNALFHKAMHFGAVPYMKTRAPATDEPRIRLPRWAGEAAADIAREMVENLRASGVRVLGDLDSLVPTPDQLEAASEPEGPGARGCVTPEVAAAMVVGIAVAAGQARGTSAEPVREVLARYATYQLAGAVLGRARRGVARGVEVVVRRGPAGEAGEADEADDAGDDAMPRAAVETAHAIEARFEAERLASARPQALLRRALGLAARSVRGPGASGGLADAEATLGDGCVEPPVAAQFALSMLEAAGVVHAIGAVRPGPLRPVLWAWLEPPELARISTWRIALALPRRLLRGVGRRVRR